MLAINIPKCKYNGSTLRLTRIAEFRLDDVIPYITKEKSKKLYMVDNEPYMVAMESQRYHTFAKSHICAICSLEGTIFLLERQADHPQGVGHFNLYGIDKDHLVLLTKDHIIPKSRGGKDYIGNYQTVCESCNAAKKNNNTLTKEQILELRKC